MAIQYKIVQNSNAEYLIVGYFNKKWIPASCMTFKTLEEITEYFNKVMSE